MKERTVVKAKRPLFAAAAGFIAGLLEPRRTVAILEQPAWTSPWTLELLRGLEPRRFEALCAAYFGAFGFRARLHKRINGTAIIDLHGHNPATPSILLRCECADAAEVGMQPLRELLSAMALRDFPSGILVTRGSFTDGVRELARGRSLELLDGPAVVECLSRSALTP
jgi:restriction system protein